MIYKRWNVQEDVRIVPSFFNETYETKMKHMKQD